MQRASVNNSWSLHKNSPGSKLHLSVTHIFHMIIIDRYLAEVNDHLTAFSVIIDNGFKLLVKVEI